MLPWNGLTQDPLHCLLEFLIGDLLETYDDVFAVRVSAELHDVLLDIAHDGTSLSLIRHIDDLLHDIVSIGISDHGFQHTVACLGVDRILEVEGDVDDGPNHFVSVSLGRVLQALLHHI